MRNGRVLLGVVAAPHGVRGLVRIKSFTGDPKEPPQTKSDDIIHKKPKKNQRHSDKRKQQQKKKKNRMDNPFYQITGV